MTDIDDALRRLKELPVDPRLRGIDDAVLAAVAESRSGSMHHSNTIVGIAAGLALSVGLLTAAIPDHEAEAASITPFGAPPALAPSTLLGAGE